MRKVNLTNEQYNRLILVEAENDAFKRNNAKAPNLKAIWKVIDMKQKQLYDEVFGKLSDKIYDITAEKAKQMNKVKPNANFMKIPKNMFSAGNSKLPASVLIVNMSSALMCPSYYLGVCQITNGACYAMRDENQYSRTDIGSVLNNNWQRDLIHTQMLQQYQNGNKKPMRDFFNLVETYIQLGNAYAENLFKKEMENMKYKLGRDLTKEEINLLKIQQSDTKITDIRLNESGDFHCQLAVDLWSKFARKIKKKYGINMHAYTARNLDYSKASENMSINYSHQGDGNNRGFLPRRFKAVSDAKFDSLQGGNEVKNRQPILGQTENGEFFYKCPCSNKETKCDRCGVCFAKNETGRPYTIYVKYHGAVAANGLKNLFTAKEVDGVIKKLYQNGWITDNEMTSRNRRDNKKKLNDYSEKIMAQRNGTAPKDEFNADKNEEKPKN